MSTRYNINIVDECLTYNVYIVEGVNELKL